MTLAKYTMALAGAFSLSTLVAEAQFTYLGFSDIKTYKQVGPQDLNFDGGSWDLYIQDGQYLFVGCIGNGAPFPTFPITPPCPLGTTALIVAGDFDGDGVRDDGQFWSVAQIIPAATFAPFRSEYISLEAIPANSGLRDELPIGGTNWTDDSVSLFFDYINTPQFLQRYDITVYNSSRPYAPNELDDQLDEIYPGTYQFRVPRYGADFDFDVNPFVTVQITHLEMIEAYPGAAFTPVGNEFNVTNDDSWNEGIMEIDPRLSFEFEWEGFNEQTILGTDTTFFSIKDRVTNRTLFPPYSDEIDPFTGDFFVPEAARFPQIIETPSTGFLLGPFFFEPGQQVYVDLNFRRNHQSTGLSRDTSERNFIWDVNFVDSYEGYRISGNFPDRSPENLTAPEADFDDDGMTNLEEYALQTDPANPASVLVPTPFLDPNTQQCVLEIEKRPNTGTRLVYEVEYSTDLVTWTTIAQGDPNWFIQTDDLTTYRVRSKRASPPSFCITRIRITQQ